ncbi:MAG: hypothetical protein HZB42_04685 [Sphingobacteriales bacterium]|nr:hypothetical protein [Sphingobacteriales bacterium]
MKKIFLIIVLATGAISVQAQTEKSNARPVSENQADPLVNGIPYSQYKAQQDAFKKEREARLIAAKTNNADAANNTITVTNAASKTNVAPAKKETNQVSDDENPVVPAKQQVQQPVTKQEVKPVEAQKPQVPDQFKLPANQKWDGKTVADKQNQNTTTTVNTATQPDNKEPSSTGTPQQAKKEN